MSAQVQVMQTVGGLWRSRKGPLQIFFEDRMLCKIFERSPYRKEEEEGEKNEQMSHLGHLKKKKRGKKHQKMVSPKRT